ncbi:MAG: cytochrome c3 family protein [Coriobacteriia bacterium]|nr:cytochrome c3 family protein [Coriobacteriia bacterium]
MKKTVLIVALATVFVLAFAAVASATPSRTWANYTDYYTWGSQAGAGTGALLSTMGSNPTNSAPHSGYLANTAKCGICHSVHRAKGNGVKLLNSVTDTCIGCHAVGSGVTDITVNVGTGPHSVSTTCNGRGCHVDNPHGANGSAYSIVQAKLLSKSVDTYLTSKGALGNSAASGITVALLNGDAGWNEATRSSVRTGYTCNIEGCHYQTLLSVTTKGWSEDRKGPRYDLTDHRNVTGHMTAGAAANNNAGSYTPVASCVSCHDQTDSLTGDGSTTVSGFTFPHGQVPSASSTNNTGGQRAYLWYTTAANSTGAGASYFTQPNDKAFDGACLKCHRNATSGIGITH